MVKAFPWQPVILVLAQHRRRKELGSHQFGLLWLVQLVEIPWSLEVYVGWLQADWPSTHFTLAVVACCVVVQAGQSYMLAAYGGIMTARDQ